MALGFVSTMEVFIDKVKARYWRYYYKNRDRILARHRERYWERKRRLGRVGKIREHVYPARPKIISASDVDWDKELRFV